mmetsp:Transcript_6141/g.16356  ORF Transcript_6141/g.16356 Transcript_6141/m.16356 type:complete len:430 (-) Transcript_6141:604-1893(-)|eukprot:CAMPEP_0185829500 /NCGR_PEP_ID=MMETSP1353-20130828/288_1 /TAXON_ID=1077150 /ORGANISM="Erythrolobus australicus, Strain CCMP3124" /LENGTH=429 /DNA_ID=CAMNT_0028527301 /DNA_START=242 /DNA_END=1531 /DNA_ORIENTATION=+
MSGFAAMQTGTTDPALPAASHPAIFRSRAARIAFVVLAATAVVGLALSHQVPSASAALRGIKKRTPESTNIAEAPVSDLDPPGSSNARRERPQNLSAEASAFLARIPRTGAADAFHNADQKAQLMRRIRAIAEDCLELCDTTRPLAQKAVRYLHGLETGQLFAKATSPVNCDALIKNKELDAVRETTRAPKEPPAELRDEFLMQGRATFVPSFFQKVLEPSAPKERVWSLALIKGSMSAARKRKLEGSYNLHNTNEMIDAVAKISAPGKRALVVGSENPWIEAILLAAGVREVVTLEYTKIVSEHPQLIAMQPPAFANAYLSGKLGLFDIAVSYSSLEHSGLGRYGDALNPWGDIISAAKIWCVTRPGGLALINVPPVPQNRDELVFNAHRHYGPLRLSYLMTNWDRLEFPGGKAPKGILLYMKPDESS